MVAGVRRGLLLSRRGTDCNCSLQILAFHPEILAFHSERRNLRHARWETSSLSGSASGLVGMRRHRVAVVGSGYVGTVAASCFASLDRDVVVLEIDRAKLSTLQSGRAPFFERGVDAHVHQV